MSANDKKFGCMIVFILFILSAYIIPDGQGVIYGLILVLLYFFIFAYSEVKEKANDKKMFYEYVENEKKLINSHHFYFGEMAGIAISENGNIGLVNKQIGFKIINIKEINNFTINIDGSTSSNLANAAIGGLLFGGFGSLIGSQTNLHQKVSNIDLIFNIDDFNNPVITIPVLKKNIKKNTEEHIEIKNKLNEIASLLEIVEKKAKQNSMYEVQF